MRARISLIGRHSSVWKGCLGFKNSASLRELRCGHSDSVAIRWIPLEDTEHGQAEDRNYRLAASRPNRFADKPTAGSHEIAKARGEWDIEVLDLRDYPLPLFNEAMSPAWGPSKDEAAQNAGRRRSPSLDGYIIVAAEYNRGPTGALKNALDYAYKEWNNKPVAFVGYGGVGGARAVEQLRLNAIELQMAPIRAGVHIAIPVFMELHEGREEAHRLRLSSAERQGHARPVRLVGRCAEDRARETRRQRESRLSPDGGSDQRQSGLRLPMKAPMPSAASSISMLPTIVAEPRR